MGLAVAVVTRSAAGKGNGRPAAAARATEVAASAIAPVPFDHEDLAVRRGPRSGRYVIVAVHSTVLGPALGGVRLWRYGATIDAARDALRLASGMTYKAAAAGLDLGGGKGVIMLPVGAAAPAGARRRDVLLDFADAVNRLEGRYLTAEDVGISVEDVEVMAEVTPYVSALPMERGGSGDPSPWTAVGVLETIRACCERAFGSARLADRSIAVSGLGHVGGTLARLLAEEGARLVVSDVRAEKQALADSLGARWTDPGDVLAEDVDVVAPCALGGILDHETVPRLRCRVVAGAANNQLAAPSVETLLVERGILWAPDFVANAGGIINISVEFEDGGYDPARADAKVRAIGDTIRAILEEADASATTPLSAAMAIARRRISEAAAARVSASRGAPAA